MKLLVLMLLLTVISVIYHAAPVLAAGVPSNKVTTKVGNPTNQPPEASSNPNVPTPPINSGPLGATVTCPLFQNGQGIVNMTCGTAKNKAPNGCGHAIPPIYGPCESPPYAICPYSQQLKAAVDVATNTGNGSGGNMPVYLPFIDGNQSVKWTRVSGPIVLNGGSWGVKFEYTATYGGKNIRIDLTHLSPVFNINAINSGDQVGTTKPGVDGGVAGHLHTAASIDGVWGDSIDQTFICSNRTP